MGQIWGDVILTAGSFVLAGIGWLTRRSTKSASKIRRALRLSRDRQEVGERYMYRLRRQLVANDIDPLRWPEQLKDLDQERSSEDE